VRDSTVRRVVLSDAAAHPLRPGPDPAEIGPAVVAWVRELGGDVTDWRVLRGGSNRLLRLFPAPLVVKVHDKGKALRTGDLWVRREIAMAHHLARSGCRVVEPTSYPPPGPHRIADRAASLWRYVRLADQDATDDSAATVLSETHEVLASLDLDLPSYDPAAECAAMLDAMPSNRFVDGERDVLHKAFMYLEVLRRPGQEVQWLHGDATMRNIRVSEAGAVLCDFEDAFRGPPMWDVASMVSPWWVDGDVTRCHRFARACAPEADVEELFSFVRARVVHSAVWSAWTGTGAPSDSRLRRLAWLRATVNRGLSQ